LGPLFIRNKGDELRIKGIGDLGLGQSYGLKAGKFPVRKARLTHFESGSLLPTSRFLLSPGERRGVSSIYKDGILRYAQQDNFVVSEGLNYPLYS
jgi:hypothetical protein